MSFGEDARRVARAGGDAAEHQALVLFDEVGDLRKRVEALERRAGQNSRNTSLPPSSDRGQAPKRPPRKPSGRKQGGQPGHEGVSRSLVEDPDEVVEHRPQSCRKCGRALTGVERVVGRPARHQVVSCPRRSS